MSFGFFRNLTKPRLAPVVEREHCVAGRTLPLKIVESDRARRLTLRIDSGGRGLRITVPPGLRRGEVEKFLDRHQDWLEQRLAKVPNRPQVRPGIKVPVRGVPHRIVHEPSKRGTVTLSRDERGPLMIVHGDRVHLPRRIADFLKREAKREIEALVVKHTGAVGKRAKAIRFKDTSSRWGSCTSDGNLSFSWRIMMAPSPVINYLVAHEVAHLKEMNHGPKFWKLCEQLCPDTERCKDWLKRNGGALQAIMFE
ncbi:MAG: M48 family peptidase [Mesorhizobium sp.]|uniref:M48 family metallopeptidase n=1 Tax=unclassified Mesorhizobium TaxID=325217 RepID=UPI000FE8F09F|nr:M48 family metallopeptidase [Mesorhizobium sp.]RWN25472.1 MAG: M48 family peptidase [Mesorhizobium sp.]RWN62183.1 MAG: M48 family peptidase [Mesorhizobium sp.]RWP74842.1 MAG: M48 family peptidase [Mesorhizobium sp.]